MSDCGHQKTYSRRRGWYCSACERQARQKACAHVFDRPRWAGVLGWRYYCSRCDLRDHRPRDEAGVLS